MHTLDPNLAAALADLRTRFGEDALPKLLRAAWLQDAADAHAETMADEDTRIVYAFDPGDLDPCDLSSWMEGMAESVWDVHTTAEDEAIEADRPPILIG